MIFQPAPPVSKAHMRSSELVANSGC